MMDNNIKKNYVPPYTSIGGPYRNEAYQDPRHLEAYKQELAEERAKRKAEREAKAKEREERKKQQAQEQEQEQEM